VNADPYAGVDDLAGFADARALENYRSALLAKTRHQAAFVERHLGPKPLDVAELASGNGRLLVALHGRGMLAAGTGLERAASRVAFARRWAADLGVERKVVTLEADILGDLDAQLPSSSADLVALITGAFGYFRPIDPTAPGRLLATMARACRPGGHVLLELYFPGAIKSRLLAATEGHLRTWEPLPEWDRFHLYLSELEIVDDGDTLRHSKTFIARDGTIDAGRVEELALYRLADVDALLSDAGLEVTHAAGGWSGEPWVEGTSATLVLLARRPVAVV